MGRSDENPKATPTARSGAGVLLRLGVALAGFALAWSTWKFGAPVDETAFQKGWLGDEASLLLSRISAAALAFASLGALLRPNRLLFLLIGTWFLFDALAVRWLDSNTVAWLAPASHAARFGTPLALVIAWRSLESGRVSARTAEWVLRIAVAVTFGAHGLEALQGHPAFVDLILASTNRLLDMRLIESHARMALQPIGWIDLALALGILVGRWPWIAGYMALWGAVTALSRITAGGLDRWPEALVRAPHLFTPLALAWLLRNRRRRRTETQPLNESTP